MKFRLVLIVVLLASLMQGCCLLRKTPKPEENNMAEAEKAPEKKVPKINVRFIFSLCSDIEAMRHFYSDLLGMQEQAFFNEKQFGYLSYPCEGVYLMFFYSGQEAPVFKDWAWQPGYDGGSLHVTSWAIQIPEEDFAETVKRLKDAGVKTFSDNPQWRQDSYWGFSVMDPQGNTIEVYTSPKEKPESTEWPGK
ncbi:MAG: VOC family protein [Candidatus Stahlbacteria bacterium]|nr:MAG: VOC family protein [Candidatus Stahlbacteria bacterium]